MKWKITLDIFPACETRGDGKTRQCVAAVLIRVKVTQTTYSMALFSHLWHRKAFWQISASLSILGIDSSSRQPISSQCIQLQTQQWSQFPVEWSRTVQLTMWREYTVLTAHEMILTRMYKALSELFLNSLMVAKTESMRQEKTKRNLEERGQGAKEVIHFFPFQA